MNALLLILAPLVQEPVAASLEANDASRAPSISDDGRFVAFESLASNWVDRDDKGSWDVFVCDRSTGEVVRVSDDSPLVAASPQISGDGRWIVFLQSDPARAAEIPFSPWQETVIPWKVGLFDRTEARLRWIGEAPHSFSPRRTDQPHGPSIARDGSRVVFEGLRDGLRIVQLFDRSSGSTELVNRSSKGSLSSAQAIQPSISRSGRFVAFSSSAKDLAEVPVRERSTFEDERHVFLRDLEQGTTEPVTHLALRQIGYFGFESALISDDARIVACNHGDVRWMGATHIGYVTDRAVERADRLVPEDGSDWLQGSMEITWLSSDGGRVLVGSPTSLVPDARGPATHEQVYLHELEPSGWELLSRTSKGAPGNGTSSHAVASADASLVAFASDATDLVAGDHNGSSDVFLLDRKHGTTTRIQPRRIPAPERRVLEPQGNGDSLGAAISEDGELVAFASRASNFDAGDRGEGWDTFLHRCSTGSVVRLSRGDPSMVGEPAISGDGCWVAYWSQEAGVGDLQEEQGWSMILLERQTGKIERIRGCPPPFAGLTPPPAPELSGDGSRMVFCVRAGPTLAIQVYERITQSLTTIGLGELTERQLESTSLSADGRFVAFTCSTSPPAASASIDPSLTHVYVRELESGTTVLVSDQAHTRGLNGSFIEPRISHDGHRVAFSHVDTRSYDGTQVGFVADLLANSTKRLVPPREGPHWYQGRVRIDWISPDGMTVLVTSLSSERVDQPSHHAQVFLHRLGSTQWAPISRSSTGRFGNRSSAGADASRDGSRVVFSSAANNLVPEDTNDAIDVFVVETASGAIRRIVPSIERVR